jgi:glycosyltransferase 2 family protein
MPFRLPRFPIKKVPRVFGYLLMALSGYFLVVNLKTSWLQVLSGLHLTNVFFLVAAFFLAGLMLLLMPLGWKTALAVLGVSLPLRRAVWIYFRTSIFRYLPGSFWQFTARAYLAQGQGISLSLYAAGSFLELFVLLAAGGIFSGLGLAYYFDQPLFLLVSLAAGLAIPALVGGGSRLLSRRWPIFGEGLLTKNRRTLAALGGYYLLVWLAYGTAVYVILNAFPEGYRLGMMKTIGLNTLAWSIGFLSLAPGGLGVREMGFAMLLPGEYKTIAIMAGLLLRIMEMIWEALLCLISTVMIRDRRAG